MSFFGDVVNTVASVGRTVADLHIPIVSNVAKAVENGANTVNGRYHKVTGAVSAPASSSSATLSSLITGVVNDLNNVVTTTSNTIGTVIKPVAAVLDSVTALARNVSDNLVTPIVAPINAILKAQQTLTTELHTSLQQGLKGIVQIPGEIANALTSTSAVMNRSVQQLGANNLKIAQDQIVPALGTAAGEPLGKMTEAYQEHGKLYTDNLAMLDVFNLQPPPDAAEWEKKQRETLDSLMHGTTFYDKFMQGFVGLYSVLPLIEILNEPMIKESRQLVNKGQPVDLLGIGEAIEAQYRGGIDYAHMEEEIVRRGLSPDRIKLLFELAQWLPGEGMIVRMMARGVIDRATAVDLLQKNRFTVEDANAFLDTELEIVGPGLATEMYGRQQALHQGLFTESLGSSPPPDVQALYDKNYIDAEASRLEWMRHWRIPEVRWWINAVWRGIRTKNEAYLAFEALNVPEEIWDDLFQGETKLWELWLVPDLVAANVAPDSYWQEQLAWMGFTPETSDVIIKYGKTKMKSSKSATAADLQKVSLSNAALLYDDGVIDRAAYSSILEAHGYGPEATQLTIDVTDIKNAQAERKAYATGLVDDVKLGLTTIETAVAALVKSGFTSAEVAKYQLAMGKAKKSVQKMPTEAQLNKMLKDEVITVDVWNQGMLALNYDPAWLPFLIKII